MLINRGYPTMRSLRCSLLEVLERGRHGHVQQRAVEALGHGDTGRRVPLVPAGRPRHLQPVTELHTSVR